MGFNSGFKELIPSSLLYGVHINYPLIFFVLFYVFLGCSMYCLFCVVLCIVCVYMYTVLLAPGGYQIAVKYITPYII